MSWRALLWTAVLLTSSTTAGAEAIKVASWNIANLGEAPDKPLRGHARTPADYDAIRRIIASLDADILALQEIGSIPGARAVLGDDYAVVFETRCLTNERQCKTDNDDVYTAIAYRKALAERISVFQIDDLAITHTDECGITRAVRGGVGVKLAIGGQTVWIPSLHLKASCKTGGGTASETADDCATQKQQFKILRDWIEARPAGDAVILTGDFNRRMLITENNVIRQQYFDAYDKPRRFLPDQDRKCWSRNDSGIDLREDSYKLQALETNPRYDAEGAVPFLYDPWANRDIDFFVVENAAAALQLSARQVPMTGDYSLRRFGSATLETCKGTLKTDGTGVDPRTGERKPSIMAFSPAYPSDHCPIVLEIDGSVPQP